jgi:hypothetical protein
MAPITQSRGDSGQKLENGVEVETCADRHTGTGCVTASDWLHVHPNGVHPARTDWS